MPTAVASQQAGRRVESGAQQGEQGRFLEEGYKKMSIAEPSERGAACIIVSSAFCRKRSD